MKRYLALLLIIAGLSILVMLVFSNEDETISPRRPSDSGQDERQTDSNFRTDDAIRIEDETNTPLGSISGGSTNEERIKSALIAKNNWESPESLIVKIMEQTGNFYAGSIQFEDELGGGMFYAVEDEGKMKIVFDGNGSPLCKDIDPYDFPTSMIPQCVDAETGQLVQR